MDNFDRNKKLVEMIISKNEGDVDLSWSEINDILGLEQSGDHTRKVSYGVMLYHNLIKNNIITDEDESPDKLAELKKERVKLNDLRTEINRQVRSQARYEELLEMVKYSVDNYEIKNPFESYKLNIPKMDGDVREGVLLLSDLHFGQVTENFLNNYNSNEFDKRIKFLTDRVIEISRLHNVQKINVMGLGDYINGLIHTTTRLSNRESIVEQTLQISEKLSNMIYELAKEIPYVTFSMTDDNHSRIFANKNENTDKDSFVPFMKQFIKMRIDKLSNVAFIENDLDEGITCINVCDRVIVGVHGDKDKLSTAIPRMTSILKTNIDYMCMAHYHNCKEDTFGETELIVNGSFGGSDEYSKNLRLHSKPMQKYMIFSRSYGRECTYNINVKGIM